MSLRHRIRMAIGATAIAVIALAAPSAEAGETDPVASFYKGKTVQLVVGYSTGGGYDMYARLLARYMGRHIPGNPLVVPQNMPGAGSLRAVGYLYNAAPKDGTVMGIFSRGAAFAPLLDAKVPIQFDATKLNWLGSATDEVSVCGFWHTAGIKTWKDMLSKPSVLGGTGAGSDTDVYAHTIEHVFHAPFKLVTGFAGSGDVVLAFERGETQGRCGWSWSSLMARNKVEYDRGDIVLVVQLGLRKHEALANVPLITELAPDAKTEAALELIFSRQSMARPFAMPPGVPPERLAAMRQAFNETMKDPELLAEAAKLELEIHPVDGASLDALVKRLYASPPEVVAMAREALGDQNAPDK